MCPKTTKPNGILWYAANAKTNFGSAIKNAHKLQLNNNRNTVQRQQY